MTTMTYAQRGLAAMTYARTMLGVPYLFGGDGKSGIDCSGLTRHAWAAAGLPLMDHYTVTQYEKTAHAPIGEAAPGSILFFGGYNPAKGLPHHVGLFLREGWMIDAPTEGVPVGIHDYRDYGDVMDIVGVMPGRPSPAPQIILKASDRLLDGWQMPVGKQIIAPARRHRLDLQSDGNLVIYSNLSGVWRPTWATNTVGSKATLFEVQTHGELVLYAGTHAVWSSGVHHEGRTALIMTDSGNLEHRAADGTLLWQSHTTNL